MKTRPKPYLSQMQEQYLKDTIRVTPCHSNRASEAGHPCTRYLFYARTRWQERKAVDHELQAIFELGKDLEDIVINRWLINRMGLSVIRPRDRDFSYPELKVTGHLDVYIEEEDTGTVIRPFLPEVDPDPAAGSDNIWVPCEIKGISIGTWREVDTFSDIRNSRRSWVRKYAGQMLLYLLMDNKEYGRFVLFSKEKGKIKDIPVVLADHLDEAEAILRRLEEVNEAVESGIEPPRYYEPSGFPDAICDDCSFAHICLPGGSVGTALQLLDDDVLAKLISEYHDKEEEYQRAKVTVREIDAVRSRIRTALEDKESAIVGDFHVTGAWVRQKGRKGWWNWKVKKIVDDEEQEG